MQTWIFAPFSARFSAKDHIIEIFWTKWKFCQLDETLCHQLQLFRLPCMLRTCGNQINSMVDGAYPSPSRRSRHPAAGSALQTRNPSISRRYFSIESPPSWCGCLSCRTKKIYRCRLQMIHNLQSSFKRCVRHGIPRAGPYSAMPYSMPKRWLIPANAEPCRQYIRCQSSGSGPPADTGTRRSRWSGCC